MKKRLIYFIASIALLIIEILIGLYAHGWIRNYLGDVLVVILLYTLFRTVSPEWPGKWYILPTVILVFAFGVEFLQLWGFCDRFGITNRLLRIIIGTGFSLIDLLCYAVGILPCYVTEYITPDCTVILDPPRAGCDRKLIDKLNEVKPTKIIYLSCNPITQARDIAPLAEHYSVKKLQPYNFFPHTPHIENLAILSKV